MRGMLEPLGYDVLHMKFARALTLEKSLSALKVGIRAKLTVRLFMFWESACLRFFDSDPVPPPFLPQLSISGANPPPTLLYNHQ